MLLDQMLLDHERDEKLPAIKAEPEFEHTLSMAQSLVSLRPAIGIPLDPFADMEAEIFKAQEKRSVMQHRFR